MQFTQFTDFSLRVLMYLTHQERTDLVTITEISEQFSIPRNHLVKVVNNLVKQGWVNATRGRNGGLQLAVKPSDLQLGEVIKQLEVHKNLIDCKKTQCRLDGMCHLQGILANSLRDFYKGLNQYTLADATAEPTGSVIAKLHPR